MNATQERSQGTYRTTATIVGVLYIIGTAAGLVSIPVTGSILGAPDVLRTVADHANQVALGALLVLVMGLPLAMIPALMFPVIKRWNEALAVGYVIFRGALEAFSYLALAICWLLLVVVARQAVTTGTGDLSQYTYLGTLLFNVQEPIIAVQDIAFGIGALIFSFVLWQARLIPRWISGWGLVAAVTTVVAGLSAIFGRPLDILLLPMLPQEMVMAGWLIVKGFNPTSIASGSAQTAPNRPLSAA